MNRTRDPRPLVLVTGATGYVGGRLVAALEEEGVRLRCMARRPENLRSRVAESTEVVAGDVLEPATLVSALRGVDTAYYLVHSMGSSGSFEAEEQRSARAFAEAALACGVSRIVYLGGLGKGSELSTHLRSRQRVGQILRESEVPTVELRASIILGSGSLSFEMIRALVEKLPVMITPKWVSTLAQPIAIEDVVAYLVAARDVAIEQSSVFEIGGTDRASYLDIMREYARQRGLRRRMLRVPVLTPWLSGLWLGLVTPVYARVGRKLVSSLPNETVITDPSAREAFPSIRPRGLADAVERALSNEDREFAATRWSDAISAGGSPRSYGGVRFGTRLVDSRSVVVDTDAESAFAPIAAIGGERGWYFANFLWRIRGVLDLLVGGVGLRRGRRHPTKLAAGDPLDFWRVEEVEPGRKLRLRAEMKLPGRAWLQFDVEPHPSGATIRQTAIFDPIGLTGLLYWYGIYPAHMLIFPGMLRGIAAAAKRDYARRLAGAST